MTQAVPIADFHLEELFSLSPGDIMELPAFMAGIDSNEPVIAMVSEVGKKDVTLRLTWHGIWLATRTIKSTKAGPVWEN